MSRWEESTEWPYWFIAYRHGAWWVCVKPSQRSATQCRESFGQDRLAALRALPRVRKEYAA